MTPAGLPHSEISGSTAVCASPKLIAACHVLLRFPEPRHPPYALSCLTSISGFPQTRQAVRLQQPTAGGGLPPPPPPGPARTGGPAPLPDSNDNHPPAPPAGGAIR